ncbi:MAG: hypothetical protein AMXMBFR47_45050 [Planctomycetota bacterium]
MLSAQRQVAAVTDNGSRCAVSMVILLITLKKTASASISLFTLLLRASAPLRETLSDSGGKVTQRRGGAEEFPGARSMAVRIDRFVTPKSANRHQFTAGSRNPTVTLLFAAPIAQESMHMPHPRPKRVPAPAPSRPLPHH